MKLYALSLSLTTVISAGVIGASTSSSSSTPAAPAAAGASSPLLKSSSSSRRPYNNKQCRAATATKNENCMFGGFPISSSHNTKKALKTRGGGDGVWGGRPLRPRNSRGREVQQQEKKNEEEQEEEYEYEYEYSYGVDDDDEDDIVEGVGEEEDYSDSDGYENYSKEEEEEDAETNVAADDNNVEYEYYKEEEFTEEERAAEILVDGDEENTNPAFIQEIESVEEEEEEGGVEYYEEEDEDYHLFTTPIPITANENDDYDDVADEKATSRGSKLQLVNRTVPKTTEWGEGNAEIEDDDVNDVDDGAEEEYEMNEYYHAEEEDDDEDDEEYQNPHDYLYGTPVANEKNTPMTRDAPKKASRSSPWWQYRPQTNKDTTKYQQQQPKRKKKKQWRPASASKASFVPPFYSGSHRSYSVRSPNGSRPIYTEWFSAVITAVVHPIGNAIQTITHGVTSTMSHWIAFSWSVVRNSFDFLWYGPVDGVTTTGITTREGGLSAFLLPSSSPVAIIAVVSSIVFVGLLSIMIRKVWNETTTTSDGIDIMERYDTNNGFDNDEVEDYDDEEDPPTPEEEIEFLNREFEPANPSSKDRITKAITKQDRSYWPSLHRGNNSGGRGDNPKSRRGQRQFTIKSIQNWWKERPSQQAIAIIEPQHIRNQQQNQKQQQPPSQEIKRLQKQLAISDQERAVLQQDVQRLQHKLQKTQQDARSILSQNKWLEKQTSKADQILTKAVEVERRKANEEMGRVRDSMKGVLERERMLMRGRMVGSTAAGGGGGGGEQRRDIVVGQNDLDMMNGPPPTRRLDGVKIVREVDRVEEEDDSDKPWTAM